MVKERKKTTTYHVKVDFADPSLHLCLMMVTIKLIVVYHEQEK